jgi:hypothetical protein
MAYSMAWRIQQEEGSVSEEIDSLEPADDEACMFRCVGVKVQLNDLTPFILLSVIQEFAAWIVGISWQVSFHESGTHDNACAGWKSGWIADVIVVMVGIHDEGNAARIDAMFF